MTLEKSRKSRNASVPLAAYCILVVLTLPAAGQKDNPQACLVQNEPIYTPGEDHVKDPILRVERGPLEKPIKVTSRTILEVVINSAGKTCEVRVLKAPDRETAQRLAEDVADNFRFSPATRKGKPVAVRFKVVFNIQGKVETE